MYFPYMPFNIDSSIQTIEATHFAKNDELRKWKEK